MAALGQSVGPCKKATGEYGSVVPLRDFRKGGNACRELKNEFVVNGAVKTAQSTVCRVGSK